jgi:hypothetical protein
MPSLVAIALNGVRLAELLGHDEDESIGTDLHTMPL